MSSNVCVRVWDMSVGEACTADDVVHLFVWKMLVKCKSQMMLLVASCLIPIVRPDVWENGPQKGKEYIRLSIVGKKNSAHPYTTCNMFNDQGNTGIF